MESRPTIEEIKVALQEKHPHLTLITKPGDSVKIDTWNGDIASKVIVRRSIDGTNLPLWAWRKSGRIVIDY